MKATTILLLAAAAFLIPACSPSADSNLVPAPELPDLSKIPVATPAPAGVKSAVISPYKPYNLITVKGYKSGDIVGDPSTAKINPKTGKIIESTAKYFRLP